MNVRRLAAIDMHGAHGTTLRQRIIVGEYVLGFSGCVVLGAFVATADVSMGWRIFGAWVAGIGLNYLPLASHAMSLLRPGALATELQGVEIRRELRHYTTIQFWLAVPLLFVVLALVQLRHAS